MKKSLLVSITAFAFFIFIKTSAQSVSLTLASHLSYGAENLSNIWGWKSPVDGKEYALVGAGNGMSVVDVSNPASPVAIVQIPGPTSAWREIKTVGNYAYITTESGSIGLQIVDLTNLPATNLSVATWKPQIGADTLKTIHALHADNGKVYLYGSNCGGGAVVADVTTNPMVPIYLGSYDAGGYIHDGYVQGDTMYAGHIWTGEVEIVDMTNPAAGVPLASFFTPGAFTHNTWLSTDGNTLFTTDEEDSAYLAAFDISNFGNITELDRIQSNPGSGSIPHNTYVINKFGVDYAVTSWYKDGITVVNASNPSNLVQVGDYDTSPLSGGGYGGCWGVYPYLPSGTIVVSDIDSGLYVLSPTYLGLNENNFQNATVNVYPNPFSEEATVEVASYQTSFSGSVFIMTDVFGREVNQQTLTSNRFSVKRNDLSAGIYLYKIVSGNQIVATGKLCIE